ncbi:hypothetical protein BDV19DRAFT_369356 [Aspergillus venezuelensis]
MYQTSNVLDSSGRSVSRTNGQCKKTWLLASPVKQEIRQVRSYCSYRPAPLALSKPSRGKYAVCVFYIRPLIPSVSLFLFFLYLRCSISSALYS